MNPSGFYVDPKGQAGKQCIKPETWDIKKALNLFRAFFDCIR